ncbi:MAG: hypothetical protein ACFCUO_05910 [Rhodospirillales bacterium]
MADPAAFGGDAGSRPLGSGLLQRLRTLTAMFADGGAVVTTPEHSGEGTPLFARTVIQFDGDTVTFVAESGVGDGTALERHFGRVEALLADVDRLRRQVLARVLATILMLPSVWSVVLFFADADCDWAAFGRTLVVYVASTVAIAAAAAAGRRWIVARIFERVRGDFAVAVGSGGLASPPAP